MTTAILPGVPWTRVTADNRPWWIPGESPGGLGDPEVWIDEAALDMHARGDALPAVTCPVVPDAGNCAGAVIRFSAYPGLTAPAVYKILFRRWSRANDGRPYYVAVMPD